MNSDRIEGAARDVGGRIQQAVGMATGNGQLRAEGVAQEIGGKSQNLYGQAREGLRDAREGLRDVADTMSDYAEETYDRGSRYVQQGARTVESQINQHPLTGIVLAGAAGFLIGLVVSQRR